MSVSFLQETKSKTSTCTNVVLVLHLLLILLTFFRFVSMVSFKKTLKAFSCLQLLEKDQSWKTSGKQKTWLS
jgi:hypothetical protein